MRILAAEDSFLIREGLRLLIATQPDLELVGTAASQDELLAQVDLLAPDVVITDVRMPPTNTDEGIAVAERFARTHPALGVVVLSQFVDASWARRLFDPTARGRAYLLKERLGDIDQLRQACLTVAAGGSVLDPQVVDALVGHQGSSATRALSSLTAREREVLALVARGASNQAIAEELFITRRAVEKHITAVFLKLGLDASGPEIHRRVRAVLLYLAEDRS